jgi:hypothetical protein
MSNQSFHFISADDKEGASLETPPLRVLRKRPQPHAKKGALVRKLKGREPSAVLLFEDETILRLFPELRRAWSLRGKQAAVGLSGRNAKRVLFGTINLRTGHRIVRTAPKMNQQGFQNFLRLVRSRYRHRPVWLLLDGASAHIAPKSKNAKRVLFGTINLRTGHRIVRTAPKMNQQGFQNFLRLVQPLSP